MGQIDKTEDVLSSLRSAIQLDDKRDIVTKVVECILVSFSSSPCITIANDHSEMVDREEFIQKLNFYIKELKKINS